MVKLRRAAMPISCAGRRGLGRMELVLLIVAAIAVLVTVPPWLLHLRDESHKQQKTYQLRKMGLAISNYHEIYGSLPAAQRPPRK